MVNHHQTAIWDYLLDVFPGIEHANGPRKRLNQKQPSVKVAQKDQPVGIHPIRRMHKRTWGDN